MERRLDKIDIEGMAGRLKKKYQLFKGQAENQKEKETTAALITNDQWSFSHLIAQMKHT